MATVTPVAHSMWARYGECRTFVPILAGGNSWKIRFKTAFQGKEYIDQADDKKCDFGSVVPCYRIGAAVFDRVNSTGWEHAPSDVYPGFLMRPDLRMAIWNDS